MTGASRILDGWVQQIGSASIQRAPVVLYDATWCGHRSKCIVVNALRKKAAHPIKANYFAVSSLDEAGCANYTL